jgi:ribosomal-protein-alanine N-acetyltransferase
MRSATSSRRTRTRITSSRRKAITSSDTPITTFAVLPEYRRRKIGERMLLSIFERAERLGAEWLTLEVRASNLPAQRLYEKYGFRPAGIRRRYYSDNNEDAIIMWTERLRDKSVRDRIEKLRAALDADSS